MTNNFTNQLFIYKAYTETIASCLSLPSTGGIVTFIHTIYKFARQGKQTIRGSQNG